MPTNRFFATVALIAAVGLSGIDATPAEGQLANASAASLGLSGNNTATARGFSAISVNPAGLGMPGSGFSLALMGVQGRSGLDPLKLSDFNDVAGTLMSAAVKDNWLSRIDAKGGLSGSFGAEVSEIALTMGNFGLQVSTVVGGSVTLPTGIAEAMLYGNAGRTGSPTDLSLSGASIDGFAISTAGLSLAFPMSSPSGDMAIGATFKYSVGHGVAVGRSTAGSVQSNPIRVDVDFPIVLTSEAADFANGGKGIGLDLGFMMKQGNLSFRRVDSERGKHFRLGRRRTRLSAHRRRVRTEQQFRRDGRAGLCRCACHAQGAGYRHDDQAVASGRGGTRLE